MCGKKLDLDAEDVCFECQMMLDYSEELINNEYIRKESIIEP